MDGGGKDGLMGYLKYAASTFPKQYMALISKVSVQTDPYRLTYTEHVNTNLCLLDCYMPPENFKGSSDDLTQS